MRHAFEKAVTRRMMSDVPWGVLLSGGLDSSLVAAICARHVGRRSTSFPKLHSFTIGLKDSPDLVAAKKVADFLGTIHHSYTYTIDEGADAVREVIRCLETYDVTTIRASTPMYLMSRKIKAMGIKMVISGEGADEVFGGYLYFHKAPNEQEFYDETVDKLSRLHMYDCLRCNKVRPYNHYLSVTLALCILTFWFPAYYIGNECLGRGASCSVFGCRFLRSRNELESQGQNDCQRTGRIQEG